MRKYKNPEKYIEKLKRQIQNIESELARRKREKDRQHKQLMGSLIANWKNGITETQSCGNYALGEFKPEDTIVIIGRIRKVEKEFNPECNNRSSEVEYELISTRRADQRWIRDSNLSFV